MKNIIIIQARMGSSRLPGKILLPLGKSTVLEYVVSRCQKISDVQHVIVATSTLQQDDQIEAWCQEKHVDCYRGSETDVLSRYYKCAIQYQPDYVIRVTSDCPFVDFETAALAIDAMKKEPSDILINRQQSEATRGLIVEMISFKALEKIYHISTEQRHREHVTYYAYEYAEEFKQTILDLPSFMLHPELRLTVDTEEDYNLCTTLTDHFGDRTDISSSEYIHYLLQHPEIAKLNAHIEQKPVI